MESTEKRQAFLQRIFEVSATPKDMVGRKRTDSLGREYHYAQAGAAALYPGHMGVARTTSASYMNQTCPTTAAGTMVLTLTITALASAIAENYFRGGFLQINDVTGEGHQYAIESSSAVAAAGTSIVVTLFEPIKVALTTSSQFTLVPSPWRGVVESATVTSVPVGVAPVDVPIGYYYWAQTAGVANVLIGSAEVTPAVGGVAVLASIAGGVVQASSTYLGTRNAVGTFLLAGVATEYKPVLLKLPV